MRTHALALIALAASCVASSSYADDAGPATKGPYLQHLTDHSVDVRIELAQPDRVGVTVIASPPAAPNPVHVVAGSAAQLQSVHVSGLSPSTHYEYLVAVGKTPVQAGTFTTAPASTSHDPFTFLIFGDDRSDGPAHERIVSAIAKESFDFVLNTGDYVISGEDDTAWQTFFDIERPLLRDHCLFACVGNHELNNDRAASHFERYFGPADGAGGRGDDEPLYSTFRWGRARFFLLNAFEDWAHGPERAWLERELEKSDKEAGVDLRIAAVHQGPYSAGPHGGAPQLLGTHAAELLVKHNVDLIISGHDHIYERGEAKKLKYLVSGGGGAPLYREITPLPSTRKVEATYHYVLATVTDDGVSILAKRPDGSTLDTCSFARGGSWACDPAPSTKAPEGLPAAPAAPAASTCGCDVPGAPTSGALAACAMLMLVVAGLRRRAG